MTIPAKPDEPRGAPSAAPDVPAVPMQPAAPAAEPKPQPPEHTLENARPGPRTNKNSGVPFDPIKVNGPIFVGWPKPKLALVVTGQQEGYLEPCGCAGLDRMKGGMSRRYAMFRSLRKEGWPVVALDVGGTAKGFGKQAEIKFQIAVNAMIDYALQFRRAGTVRPATAHRSRLVADHACQRPGQDDLRLRQRRFVCLQRGACCRGRN